MKNYDHFIDPKKHKAGKTRNIILVDSAAD